MPALTVLLAAGLAVLFGGFVQSGVGFGVGVVAAPIVTLLDPSVMPGATLVAATALPVLILAREAGHTDWRGVSWALAGRVAGTVAGVWVVAVISVRALGLTVGGVVLVVIVASCLHLVVPKNRWTLLTAGAVSGTTGTATSIGGPPIGLVYQREDGPTIRSTLSLYFAVGNLLALGALGLTGHLPGKAVATGLILTPCAVAGFVIASRLRQFLDRGHMRVAVLIVAAASAIILIGHSLVG
jgi:hypothetical protein